ncbi:hypothetical protein FRB98_002890 [Tulasnella sp. 332]|nr:hypothetical protein FRB98_002890 [Tulasnella sp. 332]
MTSTNATAAAITLPALLPNSYLIAYAVPLLLLSIVATLGGSFLTLDRTRSFAPIEPPAMLSQKSTPLWRLEGGVGGIVGGFLCGMHLTTYFSVLVVNRSKLSLSGTGFLIIWVLPSALLAVIGSRWRIAASVFYALIGGAGLTSLLTIIFIPENLLPRFIIAVIIILVFLVCTLFPHPSIRNWSLRICASASGSVGVVIAIALFTRAPSWSSPWLLFAVPPIVGTRNSQEKGLSAGMFLIMGCGIAVDWILKIKLGEDPDKAWDEYLARYNKELPFSAHRQGFFEPAQSFWSRLMAFGHRNSDTEYHAPSKDVLFPPDSQLITSQPKTLSKPPDLSTLPSYTSTTTAPPAFLPYPPTRRSTAGTPRTNTLAKRSPKVGLVYSDDSSSDPSSSDDERSSGPPKFRPWLKKRHSSPTNSTATTVLDASVSSGDRRPTKQGTLTPSLEKVLEYSDLEDEDVVNAAKRMEDTSSEAEAKIPGWKPAFLRNHEEETKRRLSLKRPTDPDVATKLVFSSTGTSSPLRLTDSPTPISVQNTRASSSSSHLKPVPATAAGSPAVPIGAVPATPSLIRAYNRITLAQEEAKRRASTPSSGPGSGSRDEGRPTTERMATSGTATTAAAFEAVKPDLDEGFWKRVRSMAAEYRHPDTRVTPGEP